MTASFALLILSLVYAVVLHSERLQNIKERPPIWMILVGLALIITLIIARAYDVENSRLYMAPMLIFATAAIARVFRR